MHARAHHSAFGSRGAGERSHASRGGHCQAAPRAPLGARRCRGGDGDGGGGGGRGRSGARRPRDRFDKLGTRQPPRLRLGRSLDGRSRSVGRGRTKCPAARECRRQGRRARYRWGWCECRRQGRRVDGNGASCCRRRQGPHRSPHHPHRSPHHLHRRRELLAIQCAARRPTRRRPRGRPHGRPADAAPAQGARGQLFRRGRGRRSARHLPLSPLSLATRGGVARGLVAAGAAPPPAARHVGARRDARAERSIGPRRRAQPRESRRAARGGARGCQADGGTRHAARGCRAKPSDRRGARGSEARAAGARAAHPRGARGGASRERQ